MRHVIIKKVGQDEQQNQTTATTTNIIYIKKFMSVLKTKFYNKDKIVSDKFEA